MLVHYVHRLEHLDALRVEVAVEYEWEDGEDERNSLFLKPELTFYEPTFDLEKFLNTKQEEFKRETEE